MGYNFPASPQVDDVYTTPTGAEYTWNGEAWDLGGAQAAPNEFVRISGDTMTGKLVLPDPDPTAPLDASHKKYVDRIVAEQTLWQGVWSVAANTPDLDPAVMLPLNGYSWTCQTVNPNIPEVAPPTVPGVAGLTIAAGDTVKWIEATQVYELIRAAIGISRMLVADTPPPVAIAGQQWWDSDAGKMYVRYEDPSGDTFWVQVSGGGGGSRYIVPISDTAPVATEEGELWFNSADASLYVWFDDGTGAQWVDVSGAGGGSGGLDQATADARYLQLTGGTITNDLTINSTDGPSIKMDKPAPDSGVSDLMFGIAGAAYFRLRFVDGANLQLDTFMSPPTTSNRYAFKIDRVSSKLDFSSTPTVVGAPIVLKSEHDAALARIKTLEDRLSQLERRR